MNTKRSENSYESSTSDNIYSEPNEEEVALKSDTQVRNDQVDYKLASENMKSVGIAPNDVIYIENHNANDSLGKSISDVLFSATKKVTPSTASIKSNTVSEANSSSSHSSVAFNNNNRMGDLKPTLATGEESDQFIDPSEDSEAKRIYEKTSVTNKKPGHVRQSSILSGSASQAIQVIYGSNSNSNKVLEMNTEKIYTDVSNHYASFTNRKDIRNCSTKSTTSKRPCYVYVDHANSPTDERIKIHRLRKVVKTETTFTAANTQPPTSNSMPNTLSKTEKPSDYFQLKSVEQQPQQLVSNTTNNKLDDLLTKSCSQNTGVGVIGTIGQLVPGLMSTNAESIKSTSHTESSESFMKSTNSNKSTGCAVSVSGSTSSSISSSIIMSNNNLINDLNNYRETLEYNETPVEVNKHYEDNTIYGQVYLNSSQNPYQLSSSVYQSLAGRIINGSFDRRNNLVKSGRNRKPSMEPVPNETSV